MWIFVCFLLHLTWLTFSWIYVLLISNKNLLLQIGTETSYFSFTLKSHKVSCLVLGVSRQTFLSRGLIFDQTLPLLVVPLSGLPSFQQTGASPPCTLWPGRTGLLWSRTSIGGLLGQQQVEEVRRFTNYCGVCMCVYVCLYVCVALDHCTYIDK